MVNYFLFAKINRIFSGMSTPTQAPPLFYSLYRKTHQTVTSMPKYVLSRDFCETFHPEYVQLVPFATNDKMDH